MKEQLQERKIKEQARMRAVQLFSRMRQESEELLRQARAAQTGQAVLRQRLSEEEQLFERLIGREGGIEREEELELDISRGLAAQIAMLRFLESAQKGKALLEKNTSAFRKQRDEFAQKAASLKEQVRSLLESVKKHGMQETEQNFAEALRSMREQFRELLTHLDNARSSLRYAIQQQHAVVDKAGASDDLVARKMRAAGELRDLLSGSEKELVRALMDKEKQFEEKAAQISRALEDSRRERVQLEAQVRSLLKLLPESS